MLKTMGEDVADVFVGTEIVVQLDDEKAEFDEEVFKAALKKHKVKLKGEAERDDSYIL
ncbi:MAG: hypothetical protein AAF726_03815 [Planctomycetota bacterium]